MEKSDQLQFGHLKMDHRIMKLSIECHEELLKNRAAYLLRERKALEIIMIRVERIVQENTRYESQIRQAKLRGMGSFDRDSFLIDETEEEPGEK